MKISERHIFTFEVEAESKEEAIKQLVAELNQTEAPNNEVAAPMPVSPEGFNGMQIMLLEDLVRAIDPAAVDLKAKIKELTELDMTVKNFKKIVPLLESIKNGS